MCIYKYIYTHKYMYTLTSKSSDYTLLFRACEYVLGHRYMYDCGVWGFLSYFRSRAGGSVHMCIIRYIHLCDDDDDDDDDVYLE
jgi:hypothetical protein